jgi:hypothetical protein
LRRRERYISAAGSLGLDVEVHEAVIRVAGLLKHIAQFEYLRCPLSMSPFACRQRRPTVSDSRDVPFSSLYCWPITTYGTDASIFAWA